MYYVYVIQNEKDRIYIGQTDDWKKRLARHNRELPSKTRSYTRINKGQWRIVHLEQFSTRHEALKREKDLKSHAGRDWIRSIIGSVAQR